MNAESMNTESMSRPSLCALIPPPLRSDARVRALLGTFEAEFEAQIDMALLMLNPEDVPASALPYLTAEHSLDEFIGTSGLPVAVIRRMIAEAWQLHAPKGYQQGIEGGIAMLGLTARLVQWFQQSPKARRGTHRIEVAVDRPIWPGRTAISARDVGDIQRMIHAMQRWSQDHTVQLVAEAGVAVVAGVGVRTGFILRLEPYDPGPVEAQAPARIGVGIILSRTIQIEACQ